MWDVKEPTHYSKRVGREVPGVVAVYLERATSLLVIDDYYVPPSVNKVYTIPKRSIASRQRKRRRRKRMIEFHSPLLFTPTILPSQALS